MSAGGPRTAREALIGELMGELDRLLSRVEALPGGLAASERSLLDSVRVLDEGAQRYRQAVVDFTEATRLELVAYLEQRAKLTGDAAVTDLEGGIARLIARDFAAEVGGLEQRLQATMPGGKGTRWLVVLETLMLGTVAGAAAGIIVVMMLR